MCTGITISVCFPSTLYVLRKYITKIDVWIYTIFITPNKMGRHPECIFLTIICTMWGRYHDTLVFWGVPHPYNYFYIICTYMHTWYARHRYSFTTIWTYTFNKCKWLKSVERSAKLMLPFTISLYVYFSCIVQWPNLIQCAKK